MRSSLVKRMKSLYFMVTESKVFSLSENAKRLVVMGERRGVLDGFIQSSKLAAFIQWLVTMLDQSVQHVVDFNHGRDELVPVVVALLTSVRKIAQPGVGILKQVIKVALAEVMMAQAVPGTASALDQLLVAARNSMDPRISVT